MTMVKDLNYIYNILGRTPLHPLTYYEAVVSGVARYNRDSQNGWTLLEEIGKFTR